MNLSVNTGFSDSLTVSFEPPLSNGGGDILRYHVELDPMPTFVNPIVEDFIYPIGNKKTIWQVETSVNGGIIDGGSFKLLLEANGRSYKTDSIPYDAVALSQNETGTLDKFNFTVSLVNGSAMMITSPPRNIEKLVFKGDLLHFGSQYSLYQRYEVDSVILIITVVYWYWVLRIVHKPYMPHCYVQNVFDQLLYVPLPNHEARHVMLQSFFVFVELSPEEMNALPLKTNYSWYF